MKKITLILSLFAMLFGMNCVMAQDVKVESFAFDPTDLSAVAHETLDANGKACALLKIMIVDNTIKFKSDWIIKTEDKGGSEYWVWLCEGTQSIIIKSDKFTPLEVFFGDYSSEHRALKGKHTYVLRIGIEKVEEPTVSVTFKCNVPGVQLFIDSNSTDPGVNTFNLTPGTHKVIARADNYEDYEKTFSVSQYTSRQDVKIVMTKVSKDTYELVKKANAYMNGVGVNKNYAEAYKYNKRAADMGEPAAYANLGVLYHNGWGVEQDDREAVKWWKMAAQKGIASAQQNLGYMYDRGLGGLKKDSKKAFEYFKKAAEKGEVDGMYNTGSAYLEGKGIAVNYNEAYRWLKKASDENHSLAQFALGRMYEFGMGVPVNNANALRFYQLSAQQENMYAINSLARMYYLGNGIQKDAAEAARLWRKAAVMGLTEAQMNIGGCYEEGEGVTKDLDIAAKYYRMAAAAGFAPATEALRRINK